MSNYVTLNTAEITGVGSITSGSIIPTGSKGEKGDKGDRGERGPQGLPGDARINDSAVSGVETWSSKKIVDYVQSNNTTWTPKTIEGDGKIDHTNNGYIKGLEIEGQTVKSGDSVQGVGLKTKEGYKIGVKTHGKNLFNISAKYTNDKKAPFKLLGNGFEITRTNRDSYQKVIFELDTKYKNGDYYFSFIEEGRGQLKIGFMNGTKEIIRIAGSKKVSISEEFNKIAFYVESIGVENKVIAKNIQLEENTQATKYEPYKGSIQDVILQDQLQGIGDIKDRLYYDEGYKIEKNTMKIVLNGDDEWSRKMSLETPSKTPNVIKLTITINNIVVSRGDEAISDKLSYKDGGWNDDGQYGNVEGFDIAGYGDVIIRLAKSKIEGTSKENVLNYLRSNNITIILKLKTPTTTPTDNPKEMLPATFEGVTYVMQDTGVKGTLKGEFPINSQAAITSLENRNKELEERLGQHEEMLTTLYSFYRGTLEEL